MTSDANTERAECTKCSVSCIGVRCQCRASRFVFQTQSPTVGSEIRFCGLSSQDGRFITLEFEICVISRGVKRVSCIGVRCQCRARRVHEVRVSCIGVRCQCRARRLHEVQCVMHWRQMPMQSEKSARSAVCHALASDANAERALEVDSRVKRVSCIGVRCQCRASR